MFLSRYAAIPPSATDDALVSLALLLVQFCWVAMLVSVVCALVLARPRLAWSKAMVLVAAALASPVWALILVYAGLFVFGGVLIGLVWAGLVGWAFDPSNYVSRGRPIGVLGGFAIGVFASLVAWAVYSYTGATRIADPFLMAPSAGLVFGTLGMGALHRVMLRHRIRGSWGGDRCDSCGYSLAGLRSGVCPECGESVAPQWARCDTDTDA